MQGTRQQRTLDLRSLLVFNAVCKKGSMTGAAQILGMTQSAVSQHIKHIEEYIGTSLLDRTLRPLRPTPAGRVLYDRSKVLLAEADETRALARQSAAGEVSQLRIGVLFSLSREYLTLLALHVLSHPNPPVLSVWTGLDLDHGRALLNRELDIVVTADTLEDIDGLERYQIMREPFLLVVPSSYAGENDQVDLRKLASDLPLIRYSERSLIGQQIERHFRRLRIVPPRRIQFDSSDSVVSLVARGFGWALATPTNILHAGVDLSTVRPLRFPGPGFARRISLIAREREFGQTPERLATVSRDILRKAYLPRLAAIRPWFTELVSVEAE